MVLTEKPRSASSTCKNRSISWCIASSDLSRVANSIRCYPVLATQDTDLNGGRVRQRRVVHSQGFRNAGVSHFPVDDVDTSGQLWIAQDGSMEPEIRQRQAVGQGRVGKADRARAGHGAGHVGHAVMNDTVCDIRWIAVSGRPRGSDTPALVDRHVDDD